VSAITTTQAEISFDLKMEDSMAFVEGAYRLGSGPWQVFIFSRHDASAPSVNAQAKWKSGVTGVHIRLPKDDALNKKVVLRMLSNALGVHDWAEVQGPDSIQLR
jgi:hypothetical protein